MLRRGSAKVLSSTALMNGLLFQSPSLHVKLVSTSMPKIAHANIKENKLGAVNLSTPVEACAFSSISSAKVVDSIYDPRFYDPNVYFAIFKHKKPEFASAIPESQLKQKSNIGQKPR